MVLERTVKDLKKEAILFRKAYNNLYARVLSSEEAIMRSLLEIGTPDESTPAPIGNVHKILTEALIKAKEIHDSSL